MVFGHAFGHPICWLIGPAEAVLRLRERSIPVITLDEQVIIKKFNKLR